jgi:hypothetical protein
LAQKKLVQSVHERWISGVWHSCADPGKQQAQVLLFIMDTSMDKTIRRINVNMFLLLIKVIISRGPRLLRMRKKWNVTVIKKKAKVNS